MLCPRCSARLPEVANYCLRCGRRLLMPHAGPLRWRAEKLPSPDLAGEWFLALGRKLLGDDGRYVDTTLYLLKSKYERKILGARCHLFWVFDDRGEIVAIYGPDCQVEDDYSTITTYEMSEGTLVEYVVRANDFGYRLPECRVSEVLQVDFRLAYADPRLTHLVEKLGKRYPG